MMTTNPLNRKTYTPFKFVKEIIYRHLKHCRRAQCKKCVRGERTNLIIKPIKSTTTTKKELDMDLHLARRIVLRASYSYKVDEQVPGINLYKMKKKNKKTHICNEWQNIVILSIK